MAALQRPAGLTADKLAWPRTTWHFRCQVNATPFTRRQRCTSEQLSVHNPSKGRSCIACHASRRSVTTELLQALATQFQKESLPWINDLVSPLFAGPPEPLSGVVDPQELADPDSRFVVLDYPGASLSIHYKQWEARDDRTGSASQPVGGVTNGSQAPPHSILMLHGFNGSEFNWRLVAQPMADAVAKGCRAVAYDRPPFGLSSRPAPSWAGPEADDPYTLQGGVRLAARLIRELGLGRTVLVGHSAGAPIALEVAAQYPELVAGLVLVAPAIATNPRGFLADADLGRLLRFAYTRALLATDGPGLQYVRQAVRRREEEVRAGRLGVYADDARFSSPEVIEAYLRPLRARDWDVGSLNVFRALSTGGATSWRDVAGVPVLIVQGEADTVVPPRAAQAVARALQKARPSPGEGGAAVKLVELPQCAHLPQEEQPDAFIATVSEFISKHCRSVERQGAGQAQRMGASRASNGTTGDDADASTSMPVAAVMGSMQDAIDPASA